MSKKVTFVDNHIEIPEVPKKPKKLTGTRFATAMGLNAWSTAFEVWCACTRTYESPFEDTVYTIAGKVIEPKIIKYLKDTYFLDIKDPTDIYGSDYFKKTWGDFFPDNPIFGGMWDAIGDDFVVEIKTTKRAEDWAKDIPVYYKLQAALYAYLLGFDDVMVPVAFLEPEHYDNPDSFIPSYKNIVVYEFKMSEDFPNFEDDYIDRATEFWNTYVQTGKSPDFDEKKDVDILKALRTNTVSPEEDELKSLLTTYDRVKVSLDKAYEKLKPKEDQLKEIDDKLKLYMSSKFRDGDKKVEISSKKYKLVLTKSVRNSFDTKSFQKAEPDLYDTYIKQTEVLSLKTAAIEEE